MCNECLQSPCNSRCPNNDEESIAYCWDCDCELYDGEEVYEFGGRYYCGDCIDNHRITLDKEADL